jgi:hypothetical protein
VKEIYMKKIFTALAIITLMGACSTQTALVNGQSGMLAKDEMQTFFVSGLGQTQTLDAGKICGGAANVVKVERTTSFLNGLSNMFSSGIYSPQDAKVYCSK